LECDEGAGEYDLEIGEKDTNSVKLKEGKRRYRE
jgi:hypothetical protein